MSDDFLDSIEPARPPMNASGNMDCQTCREPVSEGSYDHKTRVLRYWCSQDHESTIKDLLA